MWRIDLMNHAANVLYIIAYFFRDILWLRVMIIAGCLFEMYYRFYVAPTPLWADIIWCTLFIALNSYQLIVLIYERRASHLSPAEQDLHCKVFSVLPKHDFKTLIKAGRLVHFPEKAVIIEEHAQIENIYLLVNGRAEVIAGEHTVGHLLEGSFAGEMSFLTGNLTSAKVVTTMPSQCIVWEKSSLRILLEENDDLLRGMYAVFNKDLINKVLKYTASSAVNPAMAYSSPTSESNRTSQAEIH